MGAVFALGIAALMIRFDCLTVMGGVCLLLGLICLVKAGKHRRDAGKLRTVWKVLHEDYEEAAELLDIGVDPDGADVNHRVKVQHGEKELPHSSEEAKDPSWKTGAKHVCGKTPFLLAAQLLEDGSGGPEVLGWLKEQGCDVRAVNRFGQNAVDLIDAHQDDDQDEMRALLQA